MWDHVTIYRDEWGTPHIYADSVGTMAFGFGYAQAEDHLEAMLLAYRVANGRAAEVLGEAYAASDEFALIMAHGELAQEALAHADPVTRELAEGFAIGVNAWIADHPERTPPWAEGVRPADILALLHCYLMSFAPFHLPKTYHREPATPSANAWAVGPSQSATGEAMLFINPHADYTGPFQWHEAHLVTPGLNIAGTTLFGLPVIMQGHNGVLGWALSPNKPNTADIYAEPEMRWAPPTPGSIVSPMLQRQMEALIASLAIPKPFYVRHGDSLEERVAYRLEMANGPVVGSHAGRSCSYRVAGYRDFGALRQFLEMGRARNLAGFQEALAMHQIPCFHVVYADQEGNIFYLYNAKVANRLGPSAFEEDNDDDTQVTVQLDWDRPLPAEDSRYAWGELVPASRMPAIVNPASGFIQACGTPPWGVTSGNEIQQADWPHWFVLDNDSFRARRARHLLRIGPRSFTDIQSMAYDILVPFAVRAVPKLQEIAETNEGLLASLHPDVPQGLGIFDDWSYVADVNSPAMTFFHVWWSSYRALVPDHRNESALKEAFIDGRLDPRLALEATDRAARMMRNEFGSLSVPWGQVHTVRRGQRESSIPGSQTGQPLFLAADTTFQDGRWRMTGGYGFAMAVRFGPRVEAVSMLPFGASENPNSPHYDDQLDLMTERRFKVTRFYLDDVQRNARSGFGRVVQLRARGLAGSVQIRSQYPVKARLESSVTAPAPLPEGLSPYTVFVTPRQEPEEIPSLVDLEIYIPPELFPLARFYELGVYAYDEEGYWRPVAAQRANPEQRTLVARDVGRATYAVLGPPTGIEQVFVDEQPPSPLMLRTYDSDEFREPEIPAAPSVVQSPLETESEGAIPELPVPDVVDGPAPLSDTDLEPDEDTPTVPEFPESELPTESTGPAIAWGRVVELVPPGMDGFIRIAAEEPIGARLRVESEPPSAIPEGFTALSKYVLVECSDTDIPPETMVRLRLSDDTVSGAVLLGYSEAHGWSRLADQEYNLDTGMITATDVVHQAFVVAVPEEP